MYAVSRGKGKIPEAVFVHKRLASRYVRDFPHRIKKRIERVDLGIKNEVVYCVRKHEYKSL